MEIYVLSREMAIRRYMGEEPERKRGLLIGILNSKPPADTPIMRIGINGKLTYLTYTFDDIDEADEDYKLINDKTAIDIISDFARHRDRIESLAVHCRAGMSRSPAVAAALNEIFSLGCEEDFFGWGYTPNTYVYRKIMKNAKEMGFKVNDNWR